MHQTEKRPINTVNERGEALERRVGQHINIHTLHQQPTVHIPTICAVVARSHMHH